VALDGGSSEEIGFGFCAGAIKLALRYQFATLFFKKNAPPCSGATDL
jgi:hypothetical protein